MQGRYLLGVTAPEETLAFLRRSADEGAPDAEELAARTAVAVRRRRERPAEAILGAPEPVPARWQAHLEEVAARPIFERLYGHQRWQFAAVRLQSLLSVQPHLNYGHALERLPVCPDEAAVLELCLPVRPEPLELWGGLSEAEPPSASFYTYDPNIQITAAKMETRPQLTVSFTLSKTAMFLHVVRLGGRLYLKNGTHRAVALAVRGTEYAPCVLVEIADVDEIPRLLPFRTLMGPTPPLLTEFLDPDFYVAHPWRERVKFIRLVPQEFYAPLPDPPG
jgi:hypothetical protein